MVPRSRRAPAVAAIVLLAAVAAVPVAWPHGSSPQRTVQVVVSRTGPAAAPQQPGIAYGAAGHMVPPARRSPTAPRSPADAALAHQRNDPGRGRRGQAPAAGGVRRCRCRTPSGMPPSWAPSTRSRQSAPSCSSAPHDPLPLLRQLSRRVGGAMAVSYEQRGPEAWHLRLTRT